MRALLLFLMATPALAAPDDREFFEKRVRPLLVQHC